MPLSFFRSWALRSSARRPETWCPRPPVRGCLPGSFAGGALSAPAPHPRAGKDAPAAPPPGRWAAQGQKIPVEARRGDPPVFCLNPDFQKPAVPSMAVGKGKPGRPAECPTPRRRTSPAFNRSTCWCSASVRLPLWSASPPREPFRYSQKSGSVISVRRNSRIFPTRERTDFVLLD